MNTKLFLFTLIGTFYFSLIPMNKQTVVWYTKATGYSVTTAASGALVIYSLIEILNRPPLDTFTSIVAGVNGVDYFGKEAYKNIIQAWHGIPLKPTPEQAEKIITEKVASTVQSIASGSNSAEWEWIPKSGSGPSTIGTIKLRPTTESPGITQFLDEGNKQRAQSLKDQ